MTFDDPVDRIEQMLSSGDIDGAIAYLDSLRELGEGSHIYRDAREAFDYHRRLMPEQAI